MACSSRSTTSRIGFGRLVASASASSASSASSSSSPTSLTTVCHQAPLRWIPVVKNNNNMGSLVYQCHYGGGFLSNDHVVSDVHVENHARLGIVTQGYNPIYTSTSTNSTSSADSSSSSCAAAATASYKAKYWVESNGLLVVAPDPIRVHTKSKYEQHITIHLESNQSNLCYVDWISAGRISQNEVWKHSFFQTTTKVFYNGNHGIGHNEKSKIPLMVDSVQYESMLDDNDNNASTHDDYLFDPYMGYTAFVTVLLHGPMIQQVVNRCEQIQRRILLLETKNSKRRGSLLRIRRKTSSTPPQLSDTDNDDGNGDHQQRQQQQSLLQTLSPTGRVVMSMSEVPTTNNVPSNNDSDPNPSSSLYVARLAATSNEDLYRILYYCLQPLSEHFFAAATTTTTAVGAGGSSSSNNNNTNKSFYSDRIRAVHSSSSTTTPSAAATTSTTSPVVKGERSDDDNNPQKHASSPFSSPSLLAPSSSSASSNMMLLWSASMVVDSALPVGGFAHSAGIEAASQILNNYTIMGNNSNTNNNNSDDSDHLARTWIRMATQSAATFNTPIVLQCHSWIKHALQGEELGSTTAASFSWLIEQLEELDQHVHSRLVSNPPACRASLDQGKNLLRVAQSWLQSSSPSSSSTNNTRAQLLVLEAISQRVAGSKQPRGGHFATIFGVVTALLQLDDDQACYLLAYTVARDVVSAAVRLNLIGPIASVNLLANVQQAANRCILDGKQAYHEALLSSTSSLDNDAETSSSITPATPNTSTATVAAEAAITCAPLLDCIQPCHDLLAVRLFRT